jgi:hypothetical protein
MTTALLKDSTIDKAVLTIPKLKGRDDWILWSGNLEIAMDHTWDFIEGSNTTAPDASKVTEHQEWVIGDRNA